MLYIYVSFYSCILYCSDELPCDSTQMNCTESSGCHIQFCGGSASVPRGEVFPPIVMSTGRTLDCFPGSVVIDQEARPAHNCSSKSQFPRM